MLAFSGNSVWVSCTSPFKFVVFCMEKRCQKKWWIWGCTNRRCSVSESVTINFTSRPWTLFCPRTGVELSKPMCFGLKKKCTMGVSDKIVSARPPTPIFLRHYKCYFIFGCSNYACFANLFQYLVFNSRLLGDWHCLFQECAEFNFSLVPSSCCSRKRR